jgi:hypothetical protein
MDFAMKVVMQQFICNIHSRSLHFHDVMINVILYMSMLPVKSGVYSLSEYFARHEYIVSHENSMH